MHKIIIKDLNKTRSNPKFLCNAPFASMKISYLGEVSPCCYNAALISDYSIGSIMDIWNGKNYQQYRKAMKKGILPDACSICKNSLKNREYASVKIHQYDNLKVSRIFPNKIRKIEISQSNLCNLECIMCNGFASSSIRKNREKENPVMLPYMHKFREEVKPLLPDMQEIVFLGGEPFLNPLYYDIWEDMIAINPQCTISVVTNGTILNDRIKSLLERGNFKINLSFDAMTKETYEAIRVNAKFEETMTNMKYFGNTLAQQGKRLNIPICILKINRFEIPDLVRFCNKNNYSINLVNVYKAINVAVQSLSSIELIELKDFYLKQQFSEPNDISKKNIIEFKELTQRLDRWIVLAKKREKFPEGYDLKNDMVDTLQIKLIDNIYNALKSKGLSKDIIDIRMCQIKNIFDKTFTILPEYYKSNHFFYKLTTISPELYIDTIPLASPNSLRLFWEELFFYL